MQQNKPLERPAIWCGVFAAMLAVSGYCLSAGTALAQDNSRLGTDVRANGRIVRYFDKSNNRTLGGFAPVMRHYTFDHANGASQYAQDASTDGLGQWLVTKTGTQTTQILAPNQSSDGASGGTLSMSTVAAAASRESSVYQGAAGSTAMSYFDLQSVEFVEFRCKFTFTDCSSSVMNWGLAFEKTAYTDVDVATSGVWFRVSAANVNTSGDTSLLLQSDNDVSTTTANDCSTDVGVDLATATWYVFQIDLKDKSHIRYWVNGTEYLTDNTVSSASAAASKVGLFFTLGAASDNTSAMKVEISDIWLFST